MKAPWWQPSCLEGFPRGDARSGDRPNRRAARGDDHPAFALGRTQEILYRLSELEDAGRITELPVFLDRPWLSTQLLTASRKVELAKRIEAGKEASRRPQSHRPIHSAPPSANPWSIAAGPHVPASYRKGTAWSSTSGEYTFHDSSTSSARTNRV